MCAGEHGRELVAEPGEDVDDAARARRRWRSPRRARSPRAGASPTRRRRRRCRRRARARAARRARRARARSGATTATTPVGSGTVKLKYGPATGFDAAEHLRELVRPARVPDDAVDRALDLARCPEQTLARARTRARLHHLGERGRAPGRGCTRSRPPSSPAQPARPRTASRASLREARATFCALGRGRCGPTRSAGTRRRCRACTSSLTGRGRLIVERCRYGSSPCRPPSRPKPDSL